MEKQVRDLENAWNAGDLDTVIMSNTIDCHWRNRVNFLWGRDQIRTFLEAQRRRELESRLIIEVWSESPGRLSTRLCGEFRTDSGTWFRTYGNDNVEFDDSGLARLRLTTANEQPIAEHRRVLRWPGSARPADFPSLTDLGF
jgi:nuclear transport factor 2 (NTF2) superfamily protein